MGMTREEEVGIRGSQPPQFLFGIPVRHGDFLPRLLDEPSAGLSPSRQDEAFIRVSEINKAGVTTIMVEQNARRCLQICDRGYVLDQGRDAYTGTGRELLNDPKVIGLYLGTLGT